MAPDGSTTMSSRLSCLVNSDRSGIHHHHNHHRHHRRRRRSNRKWRHLACVFSASSIDYGKKLRRQDSRVISGLTDGRTDGRKPVWDGQRDREIEREMKREREWDPISLSLSIALFLSRFLSLSLLQRLFRPFSLLLLFFNFSYKFLSKWWYIYFSCLERSRLKNRNECKTRSGALTRFSLCYAINRWKRPIQEEQKNMLTYMMCICCVEFFFISLCVSHLNIFAYLYIY